MQFLTKALFHALISLDSVHINVSRYEYFAFGCFSFKIEVNLYHKLTHSAPQ